MGKFSPLKGFIATRVSVQALEINRHIDASNYLK
jgi:hypothetical protein